MLITGQKELEMFCKNLAGVPFITVDTEFLREKTYYPKLCLIQMSGPDRQAAAVDPLAEGIDLSPVHDLLFDDKILKVFHAARQDLEIFYNLTGKVVKPVFDTQVAAMVCGYGDSVGYEALVRNILGGSLDKSVQFTDWSRRPLTDKQINYALGDVTHLCGIYERLSGELEKRGRISWVYQEEEVLNDPATYENPPEEVWKRIKIRSPKRRTLAVLREIAAWREKEAQRRDVPRSWVLRDETLADMAAQAPKTVEGLKKIRGLADDLAKGRIGRELLAAIQTALQSPKESWPEVKRREPLPSSLSATVDVLKMLLKVQCAEHEVATKLVASAQDIERLAAEDDPGVPALKGWRREVFGRDALALKKGHLAIGLKGDKIIKVDLSSRI